MASVYRRSKTKGAPYYIKYVDHLGRQIQVKASPDLAASRQIAVQLESAVARKKLGLVDDAAERIAAEAKRPIDEHVADFEAHLRSKGNSTRHVTDTTMRVRTAAQVCRWAKLADITPESLNEHRERLTALGRSAATVNHHVRACKSFTRRMLIWRRISSDPLLGVEMLNVDADRRVERGAFADLELARLFKVAAASDEVEVVESYHKRGRVRTERRVLTIPSRDLIYKLAVGTGLRLGEIRSLTPSHFRWDAEHPTVRVEAKHSKRRRVDVQPLRRDLAAELKPFLDQYPAQAKPWGDLPTHMSRVIRADCRTANIPEMTDSGLKRDFHALRHTYVTRLALSGAPFRTVQELARHSTPMLTAKVYSHLGLRDTSGALEALPAIGEPEPRIETG